MLLLSEKARLAVAAKVAESKAFASNGAENIEKLGTLVDFIVANGFKGWSAIRNKNQGKNSYITFYDENKSPIFNISLSNKLEAEHAKAAFTAKDLLQYPVYLTDVVLENKEKAQIFSIGVDGGDKADIEMIDFAALNLTAKVPA